LNDINEPDDHRDQPIIARGNLGAANRSIVFHSEALSSSSPGRLSIIPKESQSNLDPGQQLSQAASRVYQNAALVLKQSLNSNLASRSLKQNASNRKHWGTDQR